ncbi:MAG: ATP-dependent Clp protease proteolytic subunit, partial [Planctomycetes bacterium]|nr:ATP-dependent Clp protease proteolytic subunit [Planctomycetota bacterium]
MLPIQNEPAARTESLGGSAGRYCFFSRCVQRAFFVFVCVAFAKYPSVTTCYAQQVEVPGASMRQATSLSIEFPLDAVRETKLLASLESLAARASGVERPIVILEFKPGSQLGHDGGGLVGRGTPFERALSIARWLTGPKGARFQSVAYLPQSIGGHAVLIALACEEIAIASDAEIGQASVDEATVDTTIRQAYLDIAAKRGSVPAAAVLSMVDPAESLVRIDKVGGQSEFVTVPELAKRERKGEEWNETQLVPNNQLARFLGQELRTWRWVAHTAGNREQLSNALRLNRPITEQPMFDGPRVAMRTQVRGHITTRLADRLIRAIESGLADKKINLVLIELNSPGGKLSESLRIAQYISDIPSTQAEVVCYVSGRALGDAALIALASDNIMMHPDAILGGPGEASITESQCLENRAALEAIARSSGRSIGEVLGCICPSFTIYEYTSFDGRTQLNTPEWLEDDPMAPQWTKGGEFSFANGLSYGVASELKLVSDNPLTMAAVGSKFGLESLPDEIRTNASEEFVDWLASQVWLSFLLFAVGITALSAEMSSPGIGFPGFLAAVCFGLFFWLRMLDGTVEWLEVLLIGGGIVCLALEFFLLPGFGVFGVGGLVMLGLGLLLAGQTFVWPTNDYQRGRMVQGFGQIGLITLSLIGLAILFRKQL